MDCVDCVGGAAAPPATLDGSSGMHFYDVSLVDGYNLPLLVAPQGAAPTSCRFDLNGACPADLRVTSSAGGVACKSACKAFGSAQYCCSGEYGNPNTCMPSAYSQFFKNACPRAYSYAYDDATSTFTCGGGDTSYAITFCPDTNSVDSSSPNPQPAGLPLISNTITYFCSSQTSSAGTLRPLLPFRVTAAGFAVMLLAVSVAVGSGDTGKLLGLAGVLAGANLLAVGMRGMGSEPKAPIGRAVFTGLGVLAAFLRRNLAVVGLVMASSAVTAVAGAEAGPVLCFAMLALLLLGLGFVNVVWCTVSYLDAFLLG